MFLLVTSPGFVHIIYDFELYLNLALASSSLAGFLYLLVDVCLPYVFLVHLMCFLVTSSFQSLRNWKARPSSLSFVPHLIRA